MPINCHFQDCKALLVMSLTHVSSAVASTRPLPLPLVRAPSSPTPNCFLVNWTPPHHQGRFYVGARGHSEWSANFWIWGQQVNLGVHAPSPPIAWFLGSQNAPKSKFGGAYSAPPSWWGGSSVPPHKNPTPAVGPSSLVFTGLRV